MVAIYLCRAPFSPFTKVDFSSIYRALIALEEPGQTSNSSSAPSNAIGKIKWVSFIITWLHSKIAKVEVRKIQTNNSWLPTITVFPIQWRSKTEKTLIAQQQQLISVVPFSMIILGTQVKNFESYLQKIKSFVSIQFTKSRKMALTA